MDDGQRERDALFGPASSQRPVAAAAASAPTNGRQQSRAPRGREGGGGRGRGAGGEPRLPFGVSPEGGGSSDRWDAAAVGLVGTERGSYAGNSSSIRSGSSSFGASQQQHQPLSWEQARAQIDVAERRRGLRSAYESVEVGRETLESLEDQREKLERSEMVLDSTRYAIERSARVLRGMTFWGKIRNAFSDDPQVPSTYHHSPADAAGADAAARATTANSNPHETPPVDENPVEGFICPDCRRRFVGADDLVEHFGSAHTDAGAGGGIHSQGDFPPTVAAARVSAGARREGWADERLDGGGGSGGGSRGIGDGGGDGGSGVDPGSLKDQLFLTRRKGQAGATAGGSLAGAGTTGATGGVGGAGGGVIADQKAFMAGQDEYLDSVGRAVAELGLLGRNIGASLDGQGDTLERVMDKTEESNDRTAFVTRKAARQAQSSKPKKPTFVMSVALQEVSTGLFLTVTGEEVVLRERELRNVCRFDAWQRQDGIIGLKSGVTGRWLGQTFLGYLRATGTSFGRNFEWQADLKRKETTMVCCSANWGAGGYLSVRPNSSGKKGADAVAGPTSASAVAPPSADSWGSSGASTGGGSNRASVPLPASAGDAGGSGADCPPPPEEAELALVDATLANKHRAAVFRLVNCDGYIPQPFIGGKLVRGPVPPEGVGPRREGGDGGGGAGGWGSGRGSGAYSERQRQQQQR